MACIVIRPEDNGDPEDPDPEDPDPEERTPAQPEEPGRAGSAQSLYVPVRIGAAGCAARFFRTPLGERTAVGFTSLELLVAALGAGQAWVRLAEPAVRALALPLGVRVLTVDPRLTAPAAAPAPAPTPTATPPEPDPLAWLHPMIG